MVAQGDAPPGQNEGWVIEQQADPDIQAVRGYVEQVVALDFLSLSRPSDTYQNILVMTDMFTRYAWAVPTRDQTAKTTVCAIWSHIIQTFGYPVRFHSDQGPNFDSDLMKQLCDLYGISKSRTTLYHPAGNGRVERMNQTLLNMLRTLEAEKQSRWPECLAELLQAYKEKGGREKVFHRNSLKLCTGPLVQPKPTAPPGNEERPMDTPVFYYVPTSNMPGAMEDEQPVRRSSRGNLGVPPARYRL